MLRGINIAGPKKIKMVDLRALFEDLGFKDVQTYIQSGNVVFSANHSLNHKALIESAIHKQYGFEVPTLLLTAEEIDNIVESNPFGEVDLDTEASKILATMLSDTPSSEAMSSVLAYKHESETCLLRDNVVYLKCPNGYGNTKLSNAFLEKKLNVVATTRN
ncbi:MAG: DUF1697 domain-containing protein [Ghiorsea sp.]